MKYIGLSLGGCLRSIMANEVSEDDVMFIVTRTHCTSFESYVQVVNTYHEWGNPYARNPGDYELTNYPIDEVVELATRLWESGRIHQPRVFVADGPRGRYDHPVGYGDGIWMEVAPGNKNTTPAVVEAYKHYKMLDALTKQ